MFRKTALIVTSFIFALCLLASFVDVAQAAGSNTPVTATCIALNRNWTCGGPGVGPNVPVTQCIEVVQGGSVTSRGDRSFASATALAFFLNNPPAGVSYQPCNAPPACVATTQDQTVACPAGQTGSIVQRRTLNVGNVCGVNSAYTEISNTCRATPSCTETTETKTVNCPAGQTGIITQSRQVNVGNVCGTNSAFVETGNTCRIPPANTCTFNGVTLTEGQTVTAYQTQTTPFGTTCISETRTCTATGLTGSYAYSNCTPQPPLTCTFNGQTIQNGASVTAYKTTTAPFGSVCESETRTCTNGVLSGTFTSAICSVNPPAVCTLPGGGTIADGASVTYYRTVTVAYGQQCESESRKCTNGTLSGSFTATNCTVTPPAVCNLPWGGTLANGQSVTAYQTATTAYGSVCTSETRTCTNGTLSGSYTYQTCSVNPPRVCTTPWGAQLNDGQSVTAYKTRSTAFGSTCESETRTCHDGSLSGSFTFQSCDTDQPNTCTLPWGGVLANGQSVTAYETSTSAYGTVCKSQTRTCNNGNLSGSYTFQSCNVTPPANCVAPWGATVLNGQSVVAYQSPSVVGTSATAGNANAQTSGVCISETRMCNNGMLSGSYQYQSCNQTCGASTETRTGVTQCPAGQSGTITETRTTNVGGQCGVNGEWTVVSNTCAVNTPDIPTVMANNPTIYSEFRYLLQITGMIPGLSCPETGTCYGPFTVFAPRNEAFAAIPADAKQAWQQPANYDVLRQILRTHIINGKYLKSFFDGKSTDIATLSGYSLNVNVPAGSNGTVKVNNVTNAPTANVVEWDRLAKNGVIHTIDRVLMPNITCAAGSEYLPSTYSCSLVCPAGTTRGTNGQCTNNTCTFNGQTLQSGQSVTAYRKIGQTESLPGSYICQSETRTCSNGSLSGSYTDATCNDYVPPSCSINLQAGNYLNLNVLQLAQQQHCPIVSGITVNLTILQGANVGSNDVGFPALTSGTGWPSNVTIKVINYGRIQGAGGDGAYVAQTSGQMIPAQAGGPAISAPYPMIFDNSAGQIWGGGGGGATIGFGHCSPAGGGGAGILPGETFDPWGSCDANGNVVAANNNSGRITRNGKNTDYLATAVTPADNEYMIRSMGADTNAAYYVSGPGGLPGQAGGNAHYYIRSPYGQPYGTPASTITGYYFYPTFPSTVFNVTGGDAGLAIDTPQNVSFTNGTIGDRRGRDYPTVPPRAPTPQPPLEQSCTAQTETRDVVCPAGQQANQQGKIVESRTMNANGVCGSTTEWSQTSNTCRAANSCTFNGQTIGDGQTVTAYQSSSAAYGGTCNYEQRTCRDGTLSGSYTASTCTVTPPATCTFNGQVIQNGGSVTAYQSGSAAYGQQCMGETRVCNNGQLSGSFTASNCTAQPPQNCVTPWGTTVGNGQTVTAYRLSTVSYGQSCQGGNVEQRLCTNGTLSGSFTNQNCLVQTPASCTGPDGRTIQSGSSVTYYAQSSMPENAACMGESRTCNNGQLYGSYGSTTCTQTMCTYAQAGDAIAKACSTTTYSGGAVTGHSTSNGQQPVAGGTSGGSTMCAYGSVGCIDNYSTNGNSGSSSSSSSSSNSNGTTTINNSNNNQNSNANSVVVRP